MKDTFKKTVIWSDVEPPKNYLWAKNDKVYEYSGDWIESKLFNNEFISVDRIGLNKTKLNLKLGKTANLSVSVSPIDSTDRTITWISSNPEIASVSSSGRVKGESIGEAVIYTAIGGKFVSCNVAVV